MPESAITGSFWRCPSCEKHVPSRQDACKCGFERSQAPRLAQEVRVGRAASVPAVPPERPRLGVILVTLATVSGLAGSGYWAWQSWQSPPQNPKDTELARKIRDAREAKARQQQPQVVHVPVPAHQTSPRIIPQTVPPQTVPAAMPSVSAQPMPSLLPQQPQQQQEMTPPTTLESETDRRRRIGADYFERQIVVLASKADQADIAWSRFAAGCRQEITTVTAFAGVADRDWIAVASVSVTTTRWPDACADLGTFLALVQQIRDGMCVAEDRARQDWIYPGVRRDIRHRHRLDWSGWDTVCRL